MRITATYERGSIQLPHPIALKHERVTVQVEIPDEEILEEQSIRVPDQLEESVDSLYRDLEAIRGGRSVPDDAVPDAEKLARSLAEDPKHRV